MHVTENKLSLAAGLAAAQRDSIDFISTSVEQYSSKFCGHIFSCCTVVNFQHVCIDSLVASANSGLGRVASRLYCNVAIRCFELENASCKMASVASDLPPQAWIVMLHASVRGRTVVLGVRERTPYTLRHPVLRLEVQVVDVKSSNPPGGAK